MKVIEARSYHHPDGRRVGLYTSHVPDGFVLTHDGYTIQFENVTSGIGRSPFPSRKEAESHMVKLASIGYK